MTRQTVIDGDVLIPLSLGEALIESRSNRGGWHHVTLTACDCEGYRWRGRCRHVKALASYLNVDDRDDDVTRDDRRAYRTDGRS